MTDQTPQNPPTQVPVSIAGSAGSPVAEATSDVQAQRRGLPGRALALFIAGGVLVTGAVITFVVIAGLAFGTSSAADCDVDGCGSRDPALAKGKSTRPLSPLVDDINHIPLDARAVFDGQPVWAIQLTPSWRVVTFDDNGVNVFQDDETGCALITSQTVVGQMAESATDSIPSVEMVAGTIEAYSAKDPASSVLDWGTIDVTLSTAQAETTIEFATATLMRTSPAGDQQAIEIMARSMPDSSMSLVATMTCDPEVHAAVDEPYRQLRTIVAVVMNP